MSLNRTNRTPYGVDTIAGANEHRGEAARASSRGAESLTHSIKPKQNDHLEGGNMDNPLLLEITRAERDDIAQSLKQTHPEARSLIEEIETLEPHRGVVIEGPAGIADQLRVVSSQGEPALPIYFMSGEGSKHRTQLGSSFDPDRVKLIASMVIRDSVTTSTARALRQAADDLLAHIDDVNSADLLTILEAAEEMCREALASLQGQIQNAGSIINARISARANVDLAAPRSPSRQHAECDQLTRADTFLLPSLDFA